MDTLLAALADAEAERDALLKQVGLSTTQVSWLWRMMSIAGTEAQERFDAYWKEVFRVLAVGGVDEDIIYDAKYNAMILMRMVADRQARAAQDTVIDFEAPLTPEDAAHIRTLDEQRKGAE